MIELVLISVISGFIVWKIATFKLKSEDSEVVKSLSTGMYLKVDDWAKDSAVDHLNREVSRSEKVKSINTDGLTEYDQLLSKRYGL